MRFVLICVLLVLLCSCHRSGTWKNDPRNWERVFGSEQPRDIKVLNSWYWRSPHFTYEFEYFFALAPNDEFKTHAIESGYLVQLTLDTKEEGEEVQNFFHEKPAWFISKPIDRYEIWGSKDGSDNFRLFIDRATGELFITDYSV